MFIVMGGTKVPFSDQRILVPHIVVTRASDLMSANFPRLWETLCSRTCAVGSYSQKLANLALRILLTPRASMKSPIRDAFYCSIRKPMRRHFVSGFPRTLLSISLAQKMRALGSRLSTPVFLLLLAGAVQEAVYVV